MISRRKRVLAFAVTAVALLAALLGLAPSLYRLHATGELSAQLDEKYGDDGWVAACVISDRQPGEQINLYRTLYLSLLYPKGLSLTPYKKLQFTHKAGWANMPPHYAVLVYSSEGEFAYRWSMREDRWYISYQNSLGILPPWDREKILSTLANIERINGLNVPRRHRET